MICWPRPKLQQQSSGGEHKARQIEFNADLLALFKWSLGAPAQLLIKTPSGAVKVIDARNHPKHATNRCLMGRFLQNPDCWWGNQLSFPPNTDFLFSSYHVVVHFLVS